MKQQVKSAFVSGGLLALTALAVIFVLARARHFRGNGEAEARVWFYDQGAHRLYPAPRDLIPPDGQNEARVRAMVIGFRGRGNDAGQIKIAYLEKYSPEFKALLERAEAAHAARLPFAEKIPSQSSAYYQENTLVKGPDEDSWHNTGTTEARQLMAEWHSWRGPNGELPIISVP